MERDLRPFVRPVSKDVFLTLLSVKSNLANLNLLAAVMQQEAFAWVSFIFPAPDYSFIYINKVYPHGWGASWCIWKLGMCQVVVCLYITRRGQALRCLSSHRGNARA